MATDLARNTGVRASASGYMAPYAPSNAINGIENQPSGRWLCSSVPAWLQLDFIQPCWINGWRVAGITNTGWKSPDFNLSNLTFQGSADGTAWTNLDSVTGNTGNTVNRTINAVCYRYVRLIVAKGLNINPQFASLTEFSVYRAPVTTLKSLTVDEGQLVPAFSPNQFSYQINVPNNQQTILFTPVANDPDEAIYFQIGSGESQLINSGEPLEIPLPTGTTGVSFAVKAYDGSVFSTYTVQITRANNTNYFLSGLTLDNAVLTPAFAPQTLTGYIATVANNVTSTAVTPVAQDPSCSITVNGTPVASGNSTDVPLQEGANTISVVVGAGSSAANTYVITVYRQTSLYLSNLVLKFGMSTILLNPAFNSAILNYTAGVSSTCTSVIVLPYLPNGQSSRIYVNGLQTASGNAVAVNLNAGANTVCIALCDDPAQGTYEYHVTVTK